MSEWRKHVAVLFGRLYSLEMLWEVMQDDDCDKDFAGGYDSHCGEES